MQIQITINVNNAAFLPFPNNELSRILHKEAQKIENEGLYEKAIYDINGNKCGTIKTKRNQ